jgi:hypothetical protein
MDLADPITPQADPADPLAIEREQWLNRLATLNRASVADTLAHVGAFADLAQVAGQLLATSAPGSSDDDSDGPLPQRPAAARPSGGRRRLRGDSQRSPRGAAAVGGIGDLTIEYTQRAGASGWNHLHHLHTFTAGARERHRSQQNSVR